MFGNEFQTSCSNFTMIQQLICPRSSFFSDRFGGLREKERVLGGGEGKTELREREGIVSAKTDLMLFIAKLT